MSESVYVVCVCACPHCECADVVADADEEGNFLEVAKACLKHGNHLVNFRVLIYVCVCRCHASVEERGWYHRERRNERRRLTGLYCAE